MIRMALIIDTETTGIDPAAHRCIEVACQLFDLERGTSVASYSSLIWSDRNEAEDVNHIPISMLATAPAPEVVWQSVRTFALEADLFIAHRAEFDRAFVRPDISESKPWVCSKFHIEWPKAKNGEHLAHLAIAHGVGVVSAHRAMTDVDILSRLFSRVAEAGQSLIAMIERAMRPRVKVAALVSYDDRERAKAAGFAWDGATKTWWRDMPADDVAALPFKTRRM